MLAIPKTECPAAAVDKLRDLQAHVNGHATFAEQKVIAEQLWSNRTDNRPFEALRMALLTLCPGGYCCYCETNEPSPVEHIWPKSHYPERTFLWDNYLFSCDPCNSKHKKARWAVFCDGIGDEFDDERTWREAPPIGDPVFLDLRYEDPQSTIRLDFETGFLEPCIREARTRARVSYTIDTILKLNERGLPEARRFAFDAYFRRLERVVALSPGERAEKAKHFNSVPQRTVWREMQRWHQRIPELEKLFTLAPEALTW